MKALELLEKSKAHLREFSKKEKQVQSLFIFTEGAEWMLLKMNELDKRESVFDATIPYEKYGYLKYGMSLFFFILSGYFFWLNTPFLLPLSILIFYFFEIHFLFLFPLSLDKEKKPCLTSIQMTYRIGLLKAFLIVIPIGVYMMLGLLNRRDPLRNWYLGCLAILIWYLDERKGF